MSESPGRRSIWPIAVIALVAGLLTTFVVIKFARREEPPVVERPKPPEPKKEPVKPAPPQEDEAAKEAKAKAAKEAQEAKEAKQAEEAAKLLAEAGKAYEASQLDKALDLARQSRRVKDTDEAKTLEGRIEADLSELARQQREKREAAMQDLRTRVGKLEDENRWDAAIAAIDTAADLKDHPEYAPLRAGALSMRDDADRGYRDSLVAARQARDQRQLKVALQKARQAAKIYPEREEAPQFADAIEKELQLVNMIRVPPPPKGVAVSLGDAQKPDEPVREYAGSGFLIDKFEVTNEDYQAFVAATGHAPPRSKFWGDAAYNKHPVVGVTAADAEAYARWAGKRLPTEDEWEYAARYVDGRPYPWGSEFEGPNHLSLCNSFEYCRSVQKNLTTEAGAFAGGASGLGIMDMAGNVWEWTATEVAPKEGGKAMRAMKGGSFMTRSDACRASGRLLDDPAIPQHDVGFRCVRDLPK